MKYDRLLENDLVADQNPKFNWVDALVSFKRDGEGERLKHEGMERASLARKELLIAARVFAVVIAQKKGVVTIDDVQEELLSNGMNPEDLGCAAGSVFLKQGDFIFTGDWVKSKRTSNHSRMIRCWRLKLPAWTGRE